MMDGRTMPYQDEGPMDETRDTRIGELLALLDPEQADPGYWHRFHRWAVNSAGPELARRRRAAAATVGDVMVSWWRALVPATALAAALAGLLLVQEAPTEIAMVGGSIEELLNDGLVDPAPLPAGLSLDGSPLDGVASDSEAF